MSLRDMEGFGFADKSEKLGRNRTRRLGEKKKKKGGSSVCVCAKEWPRLKKTQEFRRGVNERRNRQSL